jgi:hypothetical protein
VGEEKEGTITIKDKEGSKGEGSKVSDKKGKEEVLTVTMGEEDGKLASVEGVKGQNLLEGEKVGGRRREEEKEDKREKMGVSLDQRKGDEKGSSTRVKKLKFKRMPRGEKREGANASCSVGLGGKRGGDEMEVEDLKEGKKAREMEVHMEVETVQSAITVEAGLSEQLRMSQ